jgi:glycosyltransferase involved in cell wall biosynthesis
MSSLADLKKHIDPGSTAAQIRLQTIIHETPVATPRPLKVCMIGYTMYDADGRVIRYAETLAKRGDRVDFIALKGEGDPDEEVRNGVRIFRIQSRTFKEKSKFSYLFAILAFFFRTMWFFARQNPKVHYDLVHVNSVPDFLVFSAWLPKMRGAKVILDIHDLLPELYISKFESNQNTILYRLLREVERVSASYADYVIAANDIWRDKLVSRVPSIHSDRCTSILNFPDRAVFYRHGRTRSDGKFIMVFPGSLNWHQGIDIAIRALGRIKDEAPNAEFHIYGNGPSVPALEALTESLGLSGRVKMMGGRAIGEMAQIMENADLGVVPKRNDLFGDEAFSTKILEFMIMGLPVVVSGTNIDRFYFSDSVVKFFRAGDDADLADAMLAMIRNPEARDRMAQNALEFAEKYDWESNKDKYLNIVSLLTAPAGAN